MEDLKIVVAGFGGQGVLFTGKVLSYCGLIDNHEVTWLPSYGPEMRGGTANCSVCISDKAIGSPLVTNPNILIAMNVPSFDKFVELAEPGATVIVDSSLVPHSPTRTDINFFPIPATQLSNEKDLASLANIILLGKALKETTFASLETIEKAIAKSVPASKQHLLEPNMRAIKLGMSL